MLLGGWANSQSTVGVLGTPGKRRPALPFVGQSPAFGLTNALPSLRHVDLSACRERCILGVIPIARGGLLFCYRIFICRCHRRCQRPLLGHQP